MAKKQTTGNDLWFLAEDLFERGDPSFVQTLRGITDADRLGAFAATWYADPRPETRKFLFDYLDLPLNAFRHEVLVKRLFKLAWQSGDDETLARFMVLFDRSIRRVKKTRWRRKLRASADRLEVPGGTTMWRPPKTYKGAYPLNDWQVQHFQKQRLFSLATRRYLRRRAWRYFRLLGKRHPDRYVPALVSALKCYRDEDVPDGIALLDNWGLVHALFHHSPVLQSPPRGWLPAPGRSLSDLESAPLYESLWLAEPRALLELVREASCRPVRQWALHLIRRNHGAVLRSLPTEELFAWLHHKDPLIVAVAVEVLREMPDLASLGVDRLIHLVDEPNPETIESLCDLLYRLPGDRVSLAHAASLAGQRPLPVARLGLFWLRGKVPANADDYRALLGLVEAEALPLRPEILRWLRSVLSSLPDYPVDWVVEFLDSRHEDAREEGWRWLLAEPRAAESVAVWQKLLESPYDDVRLQLVDVLEGMLADRPVLSVEHGQLDAALVRLLWATVLLNVHRGGRRKPLVVGQVVQRLIKHPEEATQLLPLLAAALRSVRGPEWRAGLSGLVRAVQQSPGLKPLVERAFPELQFTS